MRIIGGKYRHRLISYPEDREDIRPTKDRIREAIFSIIGFDIQNSVVLDLYAGSGSMGLEALSRDASFVDFVDISPISKKVVLSNLKELKIDENKYRFQLLDDLTALSNFIKDKKTFDIIFLDPPYKKGKYEEVVELIIINNILSPHGIIVCESDRTLAIDSNKFLSSKEYKYGDIMVTVYRR